MTKRTFVNVSNHPSSNWSVDQLDATLSTNIVDIKFPNIDPFATTNDVKTIANELLEKIQEVDEVGCVHLMGESSLVFILTTMLKEKGYKVVCSTTERIAVEKDGVKTSVFKFVQFREY